MGPERFKSSTSIDPFTLETKDLRRYEGLFEDNEYHLALTSIKTLIQQTFIARGDSANEPMLTQLKYQLSQRMRNFFDFLVVAETPDYENGPVIRLACWRNEPPLA